MDGCFWYQQERREREEVIKNVREVVNSLTSKVEKPTVVFE